MSFSLMNFNKKKIQIVKELEQLTFLLNEMESRVELQKLTEIIDHIKQENFQIVVVGEFSRGKSTFINSLLGKRLLPSSANPTTAILNVIKYSKEPYIKIRFHDENKQEMKINEETFKRLIAPKEPIIGDPESEAAYQKQADFLKLIQNAEIGHPLSFCEGGVTLIDTPGTNDLDEAREKITNSIIPRSDAAIFLLSARKILSESELSFLRDRLLSNDIQKVFIVVNFKDELESPEAIEKVQKYAYDNLKEILVNPRIIMISALQALNAKRTSQGEELKDRRGRPLKIWDLESTGIPELESSLSEFLQYERGKVKLQLPIKRTEKLINEVLEKKVKFEKNTLTQKKVGLKEKVEAFKPKLTAIHVVGKEALQNINIQLSRQELEITKWYDSELQKNADQAMRTYEQLMHLDIQSIKQTIEQTIAPLERDLHTEKIKRMTESAKTVIEDQSNKVNEQWLKLEKDLLHIHLPSGSHQEHALALVTNTSYETSYSPSIFDEMYESLDQAWEQSNSFIGKLAIGAGYIATGVLGAISSFFSWLTGDTEKMKYKRELMVKFEDSSKKKRVTFKSEWKGMVKSVDEQYEGIINQNVQQMEQQLQVLLDSTRLEGVQLQQKLDLLERREFRLVQIKDRINHYFKELDQKTNEEKVEIFS
jgi:GTPase SAR1 family protein